MPAPAESPRPQGPYPAEWSIRTLLADPHPHLKRVYGAWQEALAREGRPLPRAGALGPVQLKQVLPDVHVYDVRPDHPRFTFRLIGTRMVDYLGSNLSGTAIADLPMSKLREVLMEILGTVDSRAAPVHIKALHAVALPNGDQRSLESLWLPFGDDGIVSRVIAVSLLGDLPP
ncbi:MAG: PAS domain-containing protein [Alphaproteobacteria bacterium]|nr:PAS domain-containing protein [Alphaproteobacteria bacterium]